MAIHRIAFSPISPPIFSTRAENIAKCFSKKVSFGFGRDSGRQCDHNKAEGIACA
jgi:hypothetical protein